MKWIEWGRRDGVEWIEWGGGEGGDGVKWIEWGRRDGVEWIEWVGKGEWGEMNRMGGGEDGVE